MLAATGCVTIAAQSVGMGSTADHGATGETCSPV
jgi:hypothetical protein